MSEELVLQGLLENTSVPDLLRTLCHDKESGELTLQFLETKKSIFLKEGRIVFAASNNSDERLGEYLLRRGLITVEQYHESARRIAPGKRQGAILCDLGYLSPENLVEAVTGQVQAIVYSLFDWTVGTYALRLAGMDETDLIALNIPTEDLIMRGIKHVQSWRRISEAVGEPKTTLKKTETCDAISYRMNLSEEELHVLSSVTGRSTVADVCTMSYLSNFETYRVLWGFLSVGCVERSARSADPAWVEGEEKVEAMIRSYNQMFALVYDALFQGAGETAQDMMAQAIKDVSPQYPDLYRHVYVDASGRVDVERFTMNLMACATANRAMLAQTALNELLYNLTFVVKRELGSEAERDVTARIRRLKDGLAR